MGDPLAALRMTFAEVLRTVSSWEREFCNGLRVEREIGKGLDARSRYNGPGGPAKHALGTKDRRGPPAVIEDSRPRGKQETAGG